MQRAIVRSGFIVQGFATRRFAFNPTDLLKIRKYPSVFDLPTNCFPSNLAMKIAPKIAASVLRRESTI